jgi:hypothetical protein
MDFRNDALTADFFREGCADSGRLAMTSKAPRSISIGVRAISCSHGATFVCNDKLGLGMSCLPYALAGVTDIDPLGYGFPGLRWFELTSSPPICLVLSIFLILTLLSCSPLEDSLDMELRPLYGGNSVAANIGGDTMNLSSGLVVTGCGGLLTFKSLRPGADSLLASTDSARLDLCLAAASNRGIDNGAVFGTGGSGDSGDLTYGGDLSAADEFCDL